MSISRLRCGQRSIFSIALITLLFVTSTPRYQSAALFAQTRSDANRVELHQALLDMTNVWTVMCVAAHPDDEDGATLTILRRKYGVHTVSLFSTFGEGGQNAIGPELYEDLGVIRANETVKAAAIQGSEPHFLGLRDFGFSKSAEETFRIWGHDEALRRMVSQIRRLRPDVIITNHDTTGGHGHHQATGRLVLEAFDVAADSERFPEPNVKEWQVQRLFVRTNYEGGAKSKALDDEAKQAGKVVSINRNELDPIRGSTYAEQALHALQQHASQGPWPQTLPKDGWPPVNYRLARETNRARPLPANASTFLDGLELPEYLKRKLTLPTINGRPLTEFIDQPERVFKAIASNRIKGTPFSDAVQANSDNRNWLMSSATEKALAVASGISASLIPQDAVIIPGNPTTFNLKIVNQGLSTVTALTISGGGARSWWNIEKPLKLKPNSTVIEKIEMLPDAKTAINLPHALHLYDERLFGEEFDALLQLKIDGVSFYAVTKTRVDVAPVVEIANITPSPYVVTPSTLNQPLTFKVRLANHQTVPFKGAFGLASRVIQINGSDDKIALMANETRDFTIRTNGLTVANPPNSTDFDSVVISVHPQDSATAISQQETRVIYSDARVPKNLRVGYVRSFDDTLRNALTALGVESQELSVDEIRGGDLQKFNTIIIDNRGYQAHPELVAANSRLMEYTKNGGTLIVFYHKTNEWNTDPAKNRPNLAPFPITLGNERVTDENAPVTFTEPLHSLLNTPNKIGQEDFKDWIQERGLYYPKIWDAKYQSLFAMSDEGEAPLGGGLLVADYGKGHYIYTSMVWYRQLRAGVPGGYRMFANMISYGESIKPVR